MSQQKKLDREREAELALALWRRDYGLRTEPTEEALRVYRLRAKARISRERQRATS